MKILAIFVALIILYHVVTGAVEYHDETACALPAGRYAVCPGE